MEHMQKLSAYTSRLAFLYVVLVRLASCPLIRRTEDRTRSAQRLTSPIAQPSQATDAVINSASEVNSERPTQYWSLVILVVQTFVRLAIITVSVSLLMVTSS